MIWIEIGGPYFVWFGPYALDEIEDRRARVRQLYPSQAFVEHEDSPMISRCAREANRRLDPFVVSSETER